MPEQLHDMLSIVNTILIIVLSVILD